MVYGGSNEGTIAHAELRGPAVASLRFTPLTPPTALWPDYRHGLPPTESIRAFPFMLTPMIPMRLFAGAVAAGASIVRELCNSPHGARGFIARDVRRIGNPNAVLGSIAIGSAARSGSRWVRDRDEQRGHDVSDHLEHACPSFDRILDV